MGGCLCCSVFCDISVYINFTPLLSVLQLSDDLRTVTRGEHSDMRVTSAPIIMLQDKNPDLVQSLLQQHDKPSMKQVSGYKPTG